MVKSDQHETARRHPKEVLSRLMFELVSFLFFLIYSFIHGVFYYYNNIPC